MIDGICYLQSNQPIFKYNTSENYYDVYVYEGTKRMALMRLRQAQPPVLEYLINNYQGSPVAVLSTTGDVKYQKYLDPWGNLEMSVGSPSSNIEFQYTDKELDEDSDLYYFQARYYDSIAGRFLGRDRVTLENNLSDYFSLNSYLFVNNNPLRYVDEDGNIPSEKTAVGTITDTYRMRGIHPVTKVPNSPHRGIDISNAGIPGGAIYAGARGRLESASYDKSGGNVAILDHGTYDGFTLKTAYMHMKHSAAEHIGKSYKDGQSGFGTVGNTGGSTGAHLHYEIRLDGVKINPAGRDANNILNTMIERKNIHDNMKGFRELQNGTNDMALRRQYETQIQELMPRYNQLTQELNSLKQGAL